MGEMVALMELENVVDLGVVKQKLRDESTVRRTTEKNAVGTRAVMLMLLEDVVSRPGLETQCEVVVAYPDEYREARQVAGLATQIEYDKSAWAWQEISNSVFNHWSPQLLWWRLPQARGKIRSYRTGGFRNDDWIRP